MMVFKTSWIAINKLLELKLIQLKYLYNILLSKLNKNYTKIGTSSLEICKKRI